MHRLPRRCLKIGSHELAWAEVSRNWRGRRQFRSAVTGLSDGIIRLSPLEPNVLNPAEFQERIRTLAGTEQAAGWTRRAFAPGMPRAVTLILPDLVVRLAVVTSARIAADAPGARSGDSLAAWARTTPFPHRSESVFSSGFDSGDFR